MFTPQPGLSLHTVVMPLRPEHESLLTGTRVRTLEILPARLFDPADPRGGEAVLARMLKASGVRVASVHCPFGSHLDLSSPDAAVLHAGRQTLDEALDLAERLGAGIVVVHSSAEPITDSERADRIERIQQSLLAVVDRCDRAGLRIAIELLPRTCIGNTVGELEQILAGLPGETVGVCLDVNHMMARHAELPAVVRRLGSRLLTLHLSDYDGVDEKHWMPGEGVIDWPAFIGALRDIDYAGPFNYEAQPHGETPAEKIRDVESNFDRLTATT